VKKLVVDTDMLIGHITWTGGGEGSELRRLMGKYFCYTTVFNAIEAFSLCRTEQEREAVQRSMQAMKILGLNAKSGKNLGELFSSAEGKRDLHLLAAGVCTESRLPMVTSRPAAYNGIAGLQLLSPGEALAF